METLSILFGFLGALIQFTISMIGAWLLTVTGITLIVVPLIWIFRKRS